MASDDNLAKVHIELTRTLDRRHGVVDGVTIDLRHELLPASDWRPYLKDFGDSPAPPVGAPFLWFPWFGPYDESVVERQAQAARAEHARMQTLESVEEGRSQNEAARTSGETVQQPSGRSIESYIESYTPEYVIQRGDRISIGRVEIARIGDDFDHPHDLEVRNAYLRVDRPKRRAFDASRPILFEGKTAVLDRDVGSSFVNEISARIRKHFNLSSIRDLQSVKDDRSYAYRALRKACSVDIATETDSTHVVVVARKDTEEFHDGSNTWYTINDAVMMGYLWGRAEAAELMMPHAKSALAAKARSARAGRVSGEKRRQAAEEGWKRIAREITEGLWQANPKLSQADVVHKIPDKWAAASLSLGQSIEVPGDSALKKLVSQIAKERVDPSRR